MSFEPREYLGHIRGECEYLLRASADVSRADFLTDETLQRAFVRSLEIIGEATKKLPDSVRDSQAQVEWRGMARMRDRLIHGYFGVDYELVWEVIQKKIPELHRVVLEMLAE